MQFSILTFGLYCFAQTWHSNNSGHRKEAFSTHSSTMCYSRISKFLNAFPQISHSIFWQTILLNISWTFSRNFQFWPSSSYSSSQTWHSNNLGKRKEVFPILQNMTVLFLIKYILCFFVNFLVIIDSLKSFFVFISFFHVFFLHVWTNKLFSALFTVIFPSFSLKSMRFFHIEKIYHDEDISKVKVKELKLERDNEEETISKLKWRTKSRILMKNVKTDCE